MGFAGISGICGRYGITIRQTDLYIFAVLIMKAEIDGQADGYADNIPMSVLVMIQNMAYLERTTSQGGLGEARQSLQAIAQLVTPLNHPHCYLGMLLGGQ